LSEQESDSLFFVENSLSGLDSNWSVGAATVGMIFFKESKSWMRIGCKLGIIFAVVGWKRVG